MHESYSAWRKSLVEQTKNGKKLEAAAVALEIDHLPFECRIIWGWDISLDWAKFDESLKEFSARVKLVADILGPVDKVGSESYSGHGDKPPNLKAVWRKGDTIIQIRAMSPSECKIDPRTRNVEQQYARLHPECKAVLDELEDYTGIKHGS